MSSEQVWSWEAQLDKKPCLDLDCCHDGVSRTRVISNAALRLRKQMAFSYGVVVLEVTCWKRPIDKDTEGQKTVNLVDWV
ncbi:hypothetical protein Bca4012_025175 [Brassica carinata]|uniref:Uncharacterized protein n=1 Tax=Brassica carinata TaxID=52824 RepID=A0A8X8AT27_BRACI|nr:hypothetical protein Bca52824_022230 [Brassica carinata]